MREGVVSSARGWGETIALCGGRGKVWARGGGFGESCAKEKVEHEARCAASKKHSKKDGTAARISNSPALKVDVHGASAWLRNTIEFLHTC